ncbi:MAG: TIGR02147 family protein [Chitinispirillaceae bacterium]|nr:TIGR02147 family protein [Chitinispirillaceae bacterium]
MMQRIEFYDDFKLYLEDYYIEQKKRFPHFSYRYFCNKAGLKSPSHFREIISGSRKLTSKMLDAFIKGMDLTDTDARYFAALVGFNQSNNATEKQQLLMQIRGLKRKVKQALVSTDQYEYYSKWYNVIIRELACQFNWHDDYAVLAKTIIPPIRKSEARKSIEFLLNARFLEKHPDGRYYQCEPAVTSGSEVSSLGIRAYNRFMAERAQKAIDEFPTTERDIQTVTVGISRDSYRMIKQEMQEFISRVVRIVDDDKNADQVYNVNVHLFPMSASIKNNGAGHE